MPKDRSDPQYKSGLEHRIAKEIAEHGVEVRYEKERVYYLYPPRRAMYTPDWVLPNNIVVESKGLFDAGDRQKHILIKRQIPELDIRFVFQRDQPLYKGSLTRYSQWCHKFGFQYAIGSIPDSWYLEPKGDRKSPADLFPQSKPDVRTLRNKDRTVI
jgi:hypothetical protein